MNHHQDNLEKLGLRIPEIPPKGGNYVPALKVGNLVYCSGQGAYRDGAQAYIGRVGGEVSLEQAQEAARIAGLNCLAEICSVTGNIDGIKRIVQIRGFVNSTNDFHDQPKVIDALSTMFLEIFGDDGNHVRCALGTSNLPGNIPVEVEMIVEAVE